MGRLRRDGHGFLPPRLQFSLVPAVRWREGRRVVGAEVRPDSR
jgi:hypothetical protein